MGIIFQNCFKQKMSNNLGDEVPVDLNIKVSDPNN